MGFSEVSAPLTADFNNNSEHNGSIPHIGWLAKVSFPCAASPVPSVMRGSFVVKFFSLTRVGW